MPITPSRIENTIPPIITASAQDQRRLEHREETLDRHLHLAVVDLRDARSAFPRAGPIPRRPESSASASLGYSPVSASGRPKPLPSRSRAVTPSSAPASTRVAERLLDDGEPRQQRDAVAEQRRQRAREPRDLDLGHEVADQRQASSPRPSAPCTAGCASRRRATDTASTAAPAIAHHQWRRKRCRGRRRPASAAAAPCPPARTSARTAAPPRPAAPSPTAPRRRSGSSGR